MEQGSSPGNGAVGQSWWQTPLNWAKIGAISVLAAVLYMTFNGPGPVAHHGDLPQFELTLLDGGVLKSQDLKGRITVLNFFATWCGPCKAEMPELSRFAQTLDPKKAAFYGIAAGYEHRLDIRAFVDQQKLSFPVALDGEAILNGLSSEALPTTVVIDAQGHITQIMKGMVTEQWLAGEVGKLEDVKPGG